MVEALLYRIAGDILKKLGSIVLQEIELRWGVNDELEKLRRTVSTVHAVLLDAEEKSPLSNQVTVWLDQLKEAFYEADDLIDEISTEALRRKVMPGNWISKKVRFYGLKMANKIQVVRNRLNEIAESRKFHLTERYVESSIVGNSIDRDTHSSTPEIVVGREDDKRVIIEMMLASCEENISVMSIVGMGGLGKTTLVQLVFNDMKVKSHFEIMSWVCVSQNFDVKLIVEKILGSVEISKNLDMDRLRDLLYEKINGKRYLIVLDDVWSDDHQKWCRLQDLLVGGLKGSVIILTTRLKKVAHMTRSVFVHELQGLSFVDSWSLFKQMAFLKGQVRSGDHEKIGKEIVTKCLGVPLAIRAMGGLLYFKENVDEWQAFKDQEISKIDQVECDIRSILLLSYNHLPSHLKNCFVYCRLFPKDNKINVPKLINLWIAQGFVKLSDPAQCPISIGIEYFVDLSWRSFFQELEKDKWGKFSFCRMHYLIHDLAAQLAGVDSVISDPNGKDIDQKTRHVSFLLDPSSPWKVPNSLFKAINLRTFQLLHEREEFQLQHEMQKEQWDVIVSNFRRLRMLDLHDSTIIEVPRSISKLKHLRHLDLSDNKDIKRIPNSITKLQNLQTLTLDGCLYLEQLPRDTKNLMNLTQLNLERCYDLTHMPAGMGQLTLLRKLSRFVVGENSSSSKLAGTLQELGKLNKLSGKLEICNLGFAKRGTSDFKEVNLKEKKHLQELEMKWGPGNDFLDDQGIGLETLQPHVNLKGFTLSHYRGNILPRWLSSLTNLVELGLSCCYNCKNFPPLNHLPYLKHLEISELSSLDYMDSSCSTTTMSTSSFFPSLVTLKLSYCRNLKGWWKTIPTLAPSFHSLSHLTINGCTDMASMPLFPPLKSLSFGYGTTTSLKRILNTTIALVEQSTPSSSSSSTPSFSFALSQLQKLEINEIVDLEYLPEDFAQNLVYLKTLHVSWCERLTTLGEAMRHLTSLEELNIRHCYELNVFDSGMQWLGLKSLRSLYLCNIPRLMSFPDWFPQAMPSLQKLQIEQCYNLESLPEWMGQLPALQNLIICDCLELSARYRSNRGAEWPKIASIPNIKIDRKVIQRNGRYVL